MAKYFPSVSVVLIRSYSRYLFCYLLNLETDLNCDVHCRPQGPFMRSVTEHLYVLFLFLFFFKTKSTALPFTYEYISFGGFWAFSFVPSSWTCSTFPPFVGLVMSFLCIKYNTLSQKVQCWNEFHLINDFIYFIKLN